MPFHKITAVGATRNADLVHYKAHLSNGDVAHFTRRFYACSPESGDLVHETGSWNGVAQYECLRPAMVDGDNKIFNCLLAAIPEPGYWHYQVIAALATANNGRIMIRTREQDAVCLELFRAGAIGKFGYNPEWAFVTP